MKERKEENMREPHRYDRRFTEKRGYDVKQLWERHHAMLREVVIGKTNVQIAEEMGCTPQTVSNVRNSPLAREVIEARRKELDAQTVDMSKQIEEFAPKALRLLEDIITGEIDGASLALRAKYAHAHLGRAGYGEVKKIQALHGKLSRDDIEALKQRAVHAAQNAGMVTEIMENEYEELD